MYKHFDTEGRHFADSHRVLSSEGQVLHWDGKGILVADVYVYRISEPTTVV